MTLSLSEARTEVQARGFDGLGPTRLNLFLNAAKDTLEDFAPWPWLESSTTGTAPLTISDLKGVLYVWDSSAGTILRGSDERFLRDQYGPDLTVTGTACWWWLDGMSTLNVFPADTSTTFSVRYVKRSDELSADGDTPLFPSSFNQAWIDLAVAEAYVDADEFASAQVTRDKAEVRLSRAMDVYFGRNLQNPQDTGVAQSVDS